MLALYIAVKPIINYRPGRLKIENYFKYPRCIVLTVYVILREKKILSFFL